MAKKTRGGGHQQHKKRRPAASSRTSASSGAPAVGDRTMDRRISLILVTIVAIMLLGTFVLITR